MSIFLVDLFAFLLPASLGVVAVIVGAPEVRRFRRETGDTSFVTALMSGELFSRRQAARRKDG